MVLEHLLALLILVVLPACLLWAAASDILTMTIPNRVSVCIVVGYCALAPLGGSSYHSIALAFIAAFAVLLICFGLFAANLMGGGDAKLLTAASLWFGLTPSLASFLITVTYVGGAVTLLFILLRAGARRVEARGFWLPHGIVGTTQIPYGLAIAIGGLLTFFNSPIAVAALNAL